MNFIIMVFPDFHKIARSSSCCFLFRRLKFLYHLNSSGKYYSIKEQIKVNAVARCQA